MQRTMLAAVIVVLGFHHAACAREHLVTMLDNKFVPKDITIGVGDTIVWSNQGDNIHTATSDDGTTFDTKDVQPGDKSKPVTFSTAGKIPYHCIHHNQMTGTITVAEFKADQRFEHRVTMLDNKFYPKEIKVEAGDAIVWANEGDNTHTATADDGTTFNTGDVKPGTKSKPVVFMKAGEIPYHCKYHNQMVGKVTVK